MSALVVVTVGSLVRLVAPGWIWAALLWAWFAVIVVREFGGVGFRLPQNARLVPSTVFRLGRHLGPYQFGVEMGSGVRTYVTSGLPYVLVPVIGLFAGLPGALAAGVGFGLGRQLMTVSNLRFSDDGAWDDEFTRYQRLISCLLTGAFALCLAVVTFLGR